MKSFLQAFNQVGNPMPLADGEGESFALDTIVLKPTLDPEETEWLSNLQRELVHRANLQYRIAEPIAMPGSDPSCYAASGWTAI